MKTKINTILRLKEVSRSTPAKVHPLPDIDASLDGLSQVSLHARFALVVLNLILQGKSNLQAKGARC